MTKILQATIRFLTSEEGGRSTPPMSGVRPHLKLGDIFTSCVVRPTTPVDFFELGTPYEVSLELPYWEEYGALFDPQQPVRLFEGERLVAEGQFLRTPVSDPSPPAPS